MARLGRSFVGVSTWEYLWRVSMALFICSVVLKGAALAVDARGDDDGMAGRLYVGFQVVISVQVSRRDRAPRSCRDRAEIVPSGARGLAMMNDSLVMRRRE